MEADRDKVSENHDIHVSYLQRYKEGQVTTRSTYYEIREAVGMMNEGLNYLYCRPNQKLFDSTLTFFDTIAVSINGSDEIHEDDIAEAMDDFADFAGGIWYARGTEDTNRVSWAFVVEQAGTPGGGSVDVAVTYILQEGEFSIFNNGYPYDDPAPWRYIGPPGFVCQPPGTAAGAEDLYRSDLRLNLVYQKTKIERAFFFTDLRIDCYGFCYANEMPNPPLLAIDNIYDVVDLENPDDDTEQDNLYDYLIFVNREQWSGFHECLDEDEMNFYYESMEDFVINGAGISELIANINIGWDQEMIAFNENNFHAMQSWYGDREYVDIRDEEPESLPVA